MSPVNTVYPDRSFIYLFQGIKRYHWKDDNNSQINMDEL